MDREAIVNVLNLYASVLDAHQWDLFDHVFVNDVEADYPGTLHWWDLKSFVRDFAAYHETLEGHQHVLANHQVIVRGDTANALTYGDYTLIERDSGSDGQKFRDGRGWYDDQLIRTPAGWRIKKRVARVFWARGAAPSRSVMPGTAIAQSSGGTSLIAEAKAGRVAYFNALREMSRALK